MRTGEGLNAKPEHGKDDSGYDTEITEPETERRPVEDREGHMKPSTDGPIEDYNESDDKVSKGYCRKCLSPKTKNLIQNHLETSDTHQLNPMASIELASS